MIYTIFSPKRNPTVTTFCLFSCALTLLYFLFPSYANDSLKQIHYRFIKPILDTTLLDPEQLDYLTQDDPLLWKYIRVHHIVPPSTKEYHLDDPNKDQGLSDNDNPTGGQYQIAIGILKNMTGGFFVEAGAYNGEYGSNTLTLERNYNWTGILIEGDPLIYPHLKRKHRKAWLSDACLSPLKTPQLANFSHGDNYDVASRVGGPTSAKTSWTTFEVQCFPIYSILSAIDVDVVDYFSLDVEGLELNVLESIPFDRLLIKVFSIEFHMLKSETKQAVKTFMESKNYQLKGQTAIDFIYAHNSVLT